MSQDSQTHVAFAAGGELPARDAPWFRFTIELPVSICERRVYPDRLRDRLVPNNCFITRRQRLPGGLPFLGGRPLFGGISVINLMSSRPISCCGSPSKSASPTTVKRRFGARRQASNTSGSKYG